MKKVFLLIFGFFLGTFPLIKANMRDSDPVLIKHEYKVIEHGFFTFYSFGDKAINKNTFSYSLNLKKQTFVVIFIKNETIKKDSIAKNDINGFYKSEEWNKKHIGISREKYFLIFHPEFLKWNNTQKLDFFIQVCL